MLWDITYHAALKLFQRDKYTLNIQYIGVDDSTNGVSTQKFLAEHLFDQFLARCSLKCALWVWRLVWMSWTWTCHPLLPQKIGSQWDTHLTLQVFVFWGWTPRKKKHLFDTFPHIPHCWGHGKVDWNGAQVVPPQWIEFNFLLCGQGFPKQILIWSYTWFNDAFSLNIQLSRHTLRIKSSAKSLHARRTLLSATTPLPDLLW